MNENDYAALGAELDNELTQTEQPDEDTTNAGEQVQNDGQEDQGPEEEKETDGQSQEGDEAEVDDSAGDDDDDATSDENNEDDVAPDDENDYIIEVGDKQYTEDDIMDLHNSGLRQEDYTKKTAALAEERKEFEAEKAKGLEPVIAEYQKSIDEMQRIMAQMNDIPQYTPQELAQLAQDDPFEYQAVTAKMDAAKRLQEELASSQTAEQQKQEQEQMEAWTNYANEQTDLIKKAVPAFNENFDGTYKQVLDYMVSQGMELEYAQGIVDAPVIKAFYDSMQLNSKAKIGEKKVKVLKKQNPVQNKQKPVADSKVRAKQLNNVKNEKDLADILNAEMGW